MSKQPTPTLAQRLRALPRHVTVDFRQYSGVWYAHWELQGVPYARRLGIDEGGQIARERQRREHLAQYTPTKPLPKYSKAAEEPTTCEHVWPVIYCAVCRERMREQQRHAVGRRAS